MRSNLDGSQIETLVEAGRGDADRRDQTRWCVGITIDPEREQIYWTQKGPDNAGQGRIFRANIEIPEGETVANRSDIEVLFDGGKVRPSVLAVLRLRTSSTRSAADSPYGALNLQLGKHSNFPI